MEVGGQRHALAALPAGKTRYPLYRRLGGTQGRSRREWVIQADIKAGQTVTPPGRPVYRRGWRCGIFHGGTNVLQVHYSMVKKLVICIRSETLFLAKPVCPWVRTIQRYGRQFANDATSVSNRPCSRTARNRVNITVGTKARLSSHAQLVSSNGYDYVRWQHAMLDDELQ